MIMVGYTIREADRLGEPVMQFLSRVTEGTFAVLSAYQEFECVLDGYNSETGIGLHESLIADMVKLARILDAHIDESVEKCVELAEFEGNERNHILRFANFLLARVKKPEERGIAIRNIMFDWEILIAKRRAELKNRIPLWEPIDTEETNRTSNAILARWPGGGSWKRDANIFAETHCRACLEDVTFVTEDLNHYEKRREALLTMTKIKEIENLKGEPLIG